MELDENFISGMGVANPPPNITFHKDTKTFTPLAFDYAGGSDPTQLGEGTFWGILGADCGKKQYKDHSHEDTGKRVLPHAADPRDKQWTLDFDAIKQRHRREAGIEEETASVAGESTTSTTRLQRQLTDEQKRITNLRAMKKGTKRFIPLTEEEERDFKEGSPKVHYKVKFPARRVPSVLAYTGRTGTGGSGGNTVANASNPLGATQASERSEVEDETERKKAVVNNALTAKPKFIASLKGPSQRIIEMQGDMKLKVPVEPLGVPRSISGPAPPKIPEPPKIPTTSRIPQPPASSVKSSEKQDPKSARVAEVKRHKRQLFDTTEDLKAAGRKNKPRQFSWRAKYKSLVKAIEEEREAATQVNALIGVLREEEESKACGVQFDYLRGTN